MSKQDVQENENLATYWRRKLDWYTTEATAEEYDEEEVRSIMSILDIVESEGELDESYYNAEKGLERFKSTLDVRMRIQDEMQRVQAKAFSRKRRIFTSRGFRQLIVAASLVMMLLVGGAVGAYAQRNGLFGKADDKDLLIAGPEDNMAMEVNWHANYEGIEDVPFKYLHCLWTPNQIPQDMQLSVIKITDENLVIRTKCEYVTSNPQAKQFITIWKNNYKNSIVIADQLYDGFSFHCTKTYNGIEVTYLVKVNDDYTEFIASFDHDNCNYSLSSNCAFDTIERVVKESLEKNNL